MALPDYFDRNAVAASQAISGLDKEALTRQLAGVTVGLTIGRDANTSEGHATADLLVRLLSRLYPSIKIGAPGNRKLTASLEELAEKINPQIDLVGSEKQVEVVLGSPRLGKSATRRFFVGSDGWSGRMSMTAPQASGSSATPFGAGVAACLAAANVFRSVFLTEPELDPDVAIDASFGSRSCRSAAALRKAHADLVLVGAGAIGNGACWALSRLPIEGSLHIVDHEKVDLGNLQRYVMAKRSDIGAEKSPLLATGFTGSLSAFPHSLDLSRFLEEQGHRHERMLLALDSAGARRAAQASLPRYVINAWTQPGDLGVSTHGFLEGACVCCLYRPSSALKNEDEIIAEAFGVTERLLEIRTLLYKNEGAPRALLEAIALAKGVDLLNLLPFEGRDLRTLYIEGFCGGAVIPLGKTGAPRADVHVPLAHQSAMAGVLQAGLAIRHVLDPNSKSFIVQMDLMRKAQAIAMRPIAKSQSCICHDPDYKETYRAKYAR